MYLTESIYIIVGDEWERRESKTTDNRVELCGEEFLINAIRGRVIQREPHNNNWGVVQAEDIEIVGWELDSGADLGHSWNYALQYNYS